jgi:hypothetical protein
MASFAPTTIATETSSARDAPPRSSSSRFAPSSSSGVHGTPDCPSTVTNMPRCCASSRKARRASSVATSPAARLPLMMINDRAPGCGRDEVDRTAGLVTRVVVHGRCRAEARSDWDRRLDALPGVDEVLTSVHGARAGSREVSSGPSIAEPHRRGGRIVGGAYATCGRRRRSALFARPAPWLVLSAAARRRSHTTTSTRPSPAANTSPGWWNLQATGREGRDASSTEAGENLEVR